ncbi:hypothetical protein Hs30E_12880 [Lactococcus hodotermopsidis]|uniref:Phage protein n=1 Tax=Pseudolactococcus hodotermopsidis TaxID=2709157 RepID=A0A6A0BFX2_9LACT|nr:hypothetical protein [Lactococcus hodotermopsidis]GFH42737.1 hypothetical protein Hs30E_12880 [Lactococcus hodotermopsidis]
MSFTGAEIVGMNEFVRNLEAKLGEARVNRIVNKTLKEIGEESAQELQAIGQNFVDPDMIATSRVSREYDVPSVKVGWSGGRWQVVHLNEFGFNHTGGKFVKQSAFGVMQGFVKSQEGTYQQKLRTKLGELTK